MVPWRMLTSPYHQHTGRLCSDMFILGTFQLLMHLSLIMNSMFVHKCYITIHSNLIFMWWDVKPRGSVINKTQPKIPHEITMPNLIFTVILKIRHTTFNLPITKSHSPSICWAYQTHLHISFQSCHFLLLTFLLSHLMVYSIQIY